MEDFQFVDTSFPPLPLPSCMLLTNQYALINPCYEHMRDYIKIILCKCVFGCTLALLQINTKSFGLFLYY